ncbi:hypothetical protein COH20_001124 [Aspergillus flavus]|nr:hypothetical protein COH21_007507 [Aspergillus flavus]RAQ70547.1 hypothetical protein COH20_001124 [Aspergillus flavus]
MSILILETVEKQADASELGDKKPAPSSRQLLRISAILYRSGGVRLLLNGISSACTYWAMHISVAKLSTTLLLSSAAHILASVLLAETHFLWTTRTILPRDQLRFVSNPGDRRRWLVFPTLVYAAAETVMLHVPAVFDSSIAPVPDEEVTMAGLLYIVRSDILVSGLMLSAQLFLLLPSYMVLILVQASLLPPTCETLIFSPSRHQRGRRVGEIFSAVNRGPLRAQEAAQMIRMGQLLSCLELHGKMCLCLVGVAAVVHSVIYWASYSDRALTFIAFNYRFTRLCISTYSVRLLRESSTEALPYSTQLEMVMKSIHGAAHFCGFITELSPLAMDYLRYLADTAFLKMVYGCEYVLRSCEILYMHYEDTKKYLRTVRDVAQLMSQIAIDATHAAKVYGDSILEKVDRIEQSLQEHSALYPQGLEPSTESHVQSDPSSSSTAQYDLMKAFYV